MMTTALKYYLDEDLYALALKLATIRSTNVVKRCINDGISLVQVADNALGAVSEILQRQRELAVQASNATLSASDRASLNLEHRKLMEEIDRIAYQTEIFGHHPILSGVLPEEVVTSEITRGMKDVFSSSGVQLSLLSGIRPITFIPEGARNVTITMDAITQDDDIQIFTREGKHLIGTPLDDFTWRINNLYSPSDVEEELFRESYGFHPNATYDDSDFLDSEPLPGQVYQNDLSDPFVLNYNGMEFRFTGDGDRFDSDTNPLDGYTDRDHAVEMLHIDEVTEPLFLSVTGWGVFRIKAEWDFMPDSRLRPI